jgi:hypothetical protein
MMELQPNPLSAMELIANEPIRVIHGRKAICDGGTSTSSAPETFFFNNNSDCCGIFLFLITFVPPVDGICLQAMDHSAIPRFTSIWYGLFRLFDARKWTGMLTFLGQDKPGPQPCG